MIDLIELLAQRIDVLGVLWLTSLVLFSWVWIETVLEWERDKQTLEGAV